MTGTRRDGGGGGGDHQAFVHHFYTIQCTTTVLQTQMS